MQLEEKKEGRAEKGTIEFTQAVVSEAEGAPPVTSKTSASSEALPTLISVLSFNGVKTMNRHTIYAIAVLSSTGGFYIDTLLDVVVLLNFLLSGQMFFFYISASIMFFSSAIVSIACFNSSREDHRYENAYVVAFLAFIRVQLFIEMLESLSPHPQLTLKGF